MTSFQELCRNLQKTLPEVNTFEPKMVKKGSKWPKNSEIADILERIALLLSANGESAFRVGSYRKAAITVRNSRKGVAGLALPKNGARLQEMEGIGAKLSAVIREYVQTGGVELLRTLRKSVRPEDPLSLVDGIDWID